MTDFAALLLADRGEAGRPLHLLTAATIDGWRAGLGERAREALAAARFAGRPGETCIVPGEAPADWAMAIGIADAAVPGAWDLAAAAQRLPAGTYRLADGAPGVAAYGWLLAQHRMGRYKADPDAAGPRVLLSPDAGAVIEAVRLAEAAALARDLIDTPASDLGPAELAAAVLAEGRRFGAEVSVITGEALLAANYPAIHAVGRAAAGAPRLIELTWGAASAPRLTLVGKGVTFDSGGLNIKAAAGMALMKKDMGGAAVLLALARLTMQAELPVRLTLLVPAVENAIAGNAFRPGDVLATRAGLTVEIGNTDAEGRLILADALTRAQEDGAPDLLIDAATLTGAARVALGPDLPALFANDDALAEAALAAGVAAGEPLWQLPLWPGYRELLQSPVADLGNAPEGGFAGAITAALFLERFVAAGTPWLHLDLYGWQPTAKSGRPKGGEATALRALWQLVRTRYARQPMSAS